MDFSKGFKINYLDNPNDSYGLKLPSPDYSFFDNNNNRVLLHEIKNDENITPRRINELINVMGADINCQNSLKQTPLMIALKKENVKMDIIHFLLTREDIDVDIQDANGETALFYIVKNKNIDVKKKEKIIELLFSRNADKNIRNNKGKMVIDYAKNENIRDLISEFRYNPPSLLRSAMDEYKKRRPPEQPRFFIPGFEPLPQTKEAKDREFQKEVINGIIEHNKSRKGGKRRKKSNKNKKTRKVRKR